MIIIVLSFLIYCIILYCWTMFLKLACSRLLIPIQWNNVGGLRSFSAQTESLISTSTKHGIKMITLTDLTKRNALSLAMLQELHAEIEKSSHESDLRVIILNSAPPIFSSGHSLKELRTEAGLTTHAKVLNACTKFMKSVQDIQIPVIAQVRGLAAAAGCQLVASCDIVVASRNAQFSTPGVKVGLFCSTPGVALCRAVPRKVAMDMMMTGESIDAEEALRAGLVSRVVDDEKLEEETLKVAQTICSYSRPVIAIGKTLFYSQVDADRNTAYRLAEKVMLENLKLADCQEGLDGFFEKRKPKWSHTSKKIA